MHHFLCDVCKQLYPTTIAVPYKAGRACPNCASEYAQDTRQWSAGDEHRCRNCCLLFPVGMLGEHNDRLCPTCLAASDCSEQAYFAQRTDRYKGSPLFHKEGTPSEADAAPAPSKWRIPPRSPKPSPQAPPIPRRAGRTTVSSGSPYEPRFGFSRAVRVGRHVAVAGTAPIAPDGSTAHPGDPAAQTRRCLAIIAQALEQAGASLADVVRTRIMVADRAHWTAAASAHGEVFGDIRPATTLVVVAGFIDPEWLVEIEADAIVDG